MSNIQLMNDLNALYQHKLLLPLKLQYKDYSEWMSHRDMTKHRQYWLSQFKDEVPILSLPTDYVRPNIKTTNGAMDVIYNESTNETATSKVCRKASNY